MQHAKIVFETANAGATPKTGSIFNLAAFTVIPKQ